MARTNRPSRPPVAEALKREPQQFDFAQAVRLLEALGAAQAKVPVGAEGPPGRESIRFRAAATATFPAADIDRLEPAPKAPENENQQDGSILPVELTVNFLGLIGPQGTLPHHYTHLVVSRLHPRHKDQTLKQFLDLIHHRSTSLFFRAWVKHRLPASYETAVRWNDEHKRDLFTIVLECLVGLGTRGLRDRPACGTETALGYGGHFVHFPRNAVSLERLLCDWLGWPVDVLQFFGRWLPLPKSSQSSLPSRTNPQGQNTGLGVSTIIGSRVWDCQGKIRVRMGPLTYRQFRTIMPDGSRFRPLCDLVRLYVGPEFDFDLQPALLPSELPACRLGAATEPRLGWNTWLSSSPPAHNVDDAVFRPPPLDAL